MSTDTPTVNQQHHVVYRQERTHFFVDVDLQVPQQDVLVGLVLTQLVQHLQRGSRELHILAGGVEQAESERGQRGHPAVLAGRRLRKSVFFLDDTRRDAVDLHVGVSVLIVVFGGEILQSDRQQSRSRRHAGFSGHGRGEELRSQGVHRDEVGRDVARRGEHDDTQLSNGDGFGDDDDHQRDEHLDDDDVHQFGLVDDDGGQGYGTDHAGPDRSDNPAEALEHLTQFLRNQ
jgi:hypothetical protein